MKGAMKSDCIFLATNGDTLAINAASPNKHTNLHAVKNLEGGKGKMVFVLFNKLGFSNIFSGFYLKCTTSTRTHIYCKVVTFFY